MVQLKQGDVIAIEQKGHYYYAVILSKIIYFGGNLVYAFHTKSKNLLALNELIQKKSKGFNAIVDIKDSYGNTPLSNAVFNCRNGNGQVIKLLRAAGADPNNKNNYGISPLELAKQIANYNVKLTGTL